jgi:putative DNA primase/helicase
MRAVPDRVWSSDPQLAEAAEVQRAIYLADARPPEFSDEALALQFSARHADELRFCAVWNRWFQWNGGYWRPDETLKAFDLARAICRTVSAALPTEKSKIATGVASAKTVAAIVTLARSDRRHAATADQWDQDPWLFLAGNR